MSVLSTAARRRPAPGFTLIELAIVLAIVAILLRVGAPGMSRTVAARALAAQSSEFMAALRFARAAAMQRGMDVTMCASAPGGPPLACQGSRAADWRGGWIVFADRGRRGVPEAGAPLLRIQQALQRSGPVVLCRTDAASTSHCAGSGGSWQTWLLFTDLGRNGAWVAGDSVVRQHIDVSNRMSVTSGAASIRFESTGIAHSDNGAPVVFLFAPAGASSDSTGSDLALKRQVCVNPRGEVAVIAGGATCP